MVCGCLHSYFGCQLLILLLDEYEYEYRYLNTGALYHHRCVMPYDPVVERHVHCPVTALKRSLL